MENLDTSFMKEALAEAERCFQMGEVPIGAVVVKDGEIIGRGHNTRERDHDISGHAEINAMKEAAARLGSWNLSGCTLYVTLEPCSMCTGAILQSRIRTLVYGLEDPEEGGLSKYHLFEYGNASTLVEGGLLKEECAALLREFFERLRK